MNRAVVSTTANIVDLLPVEDGIVSQLDRELPNGDTERVWAVEFNSQTIMIHFVFDSSDEIEEAFAALVAKGANLLRFLGRKYVEADTNTDDLLRSFQTVFNVLQNQKIELEQELDEIYPDIEDGNSPTVGEKDE